MFYPINNWAYIARKQVEYLLSIVEETTFNKHSLIGLNDQVNNYLNYVWQYIRDNGWLIYNTEKNQVAFNIRLKPRIESGDDYIFAIFAKNDKPSCQEWKLICFAVRGKNGNKFGNLNIDIDLYSDISQSFPSIVIPKEFTLSFGFNHLFVEDQKHPECRAWERIPSAILNRFTDWSSGTKHLLSSLIKFSILNDSENISRYTRTEEDVRTVSTSFDTDKFLKIINFNDEDSLVAKKDKVLNELPYSYLYPVCIQHRNKPDFAMVFRKKGKGKYTQYIGKTILKLADAQMSARVCQPDLKDTWLSDENVNR